MKKRFLVLVEACHEALRTLFDHMPVSIQQKEFSSFVTIVCVTGEIGRESKRSNEQPDLHGHLIESTINLLEEDLFVIAVFSACIHISRAISSETISSASISSLEKALEKLRFAQAQLCEEKSLSGAA